MVIFTICHFRNSHTKIYVIGQLSNVYSILNQLRYLANKTSCTFCGNIRPKNIASNCQMTMERLKKIHDRCIGVLNEKYIKETTLRNTTSLRKFCQAVQHQKMRHLLHPVNE